MKQIRPKTVRYISGHSIKKIDDHRNHILTFSTNTFSTLFIDSH